MDKKNFAFPKSCRMLKANQFRRVSKYGSTLNGRYLRIQVCDSKKSSLKMGLTVTRKYGGAVQRNRFKRLVREAFRLSRSQILSLIHLNIAPKQSTGELTLALILADFKELIPSLDAVGKN